MRAAKVQASLRLCAVSPEPPLLAHTSSESRGTFRQKARSLAPLNGWTCAVKICHDGMLEDTNSLDGAQVLYHFRLQHFKDMASTATFHILFLELKNRLQTRKGSNCKVTEKCIFVRPSLNQDYPGGKLRSLLSSISAWIHHYENCFRHMAC